MRIYSVDKNFTVKVWRSVEFFESQHSRNCPDILKAVTKAELNTYKEKVLMSDEGEYTLQGKVFPESQAIAHNILVRLNGK